MAKAAGRAGMDEAEWATRVDLAACYRLVAHFRMDDLIYNHISARVPGAHGHFLINPYGMAYEEITASSLIKIDLDGNVVDDGGQDYGVNHAGFVIHSAVHRARPEVDCVIHTHTPAGMAVSALECGLLPLSQTAMFFGRVAMHEYEGVVVDLGEQQRLVADLGDSQAMILRNHGLLTVGPSIAEAFTAMYWLERACQAQAMAMACNAPLHLPAPAVVELTNHLYKPTTRRPFGLLEWPALLRLLDRRDDSYRL
ncbi:class II aldolase/adducin family protein [Pigmentiphaga sp. GD03639]|jgi:ribulose-5-phosphate 4-epimerase/fuculose-1-phosphate aldolase|uniref:class II aldolase/adducin family protein n=1 Tax=Pigmentiphaga sp. GD03639 TaxID=2975354 RepID=UPI00244820C9|nr:class II aldolase/adducin family protein [Pigmentiphaga sp. GD03639]MDH2237234.1 class II aldolase/adducin family protein [Pigmentiphaga sp. GD03639]